MMRKCRWGVLLLAFSACPLEWQMRNRARPSIRGRVLDEQDAVLPGVAIVVTHQGTGIFRETVTGSDGVFLVTDLVPGPYRITAELQGFKTLTRGDVILTGGLTQTLDLKLEVGSVAESITVTGQIPQVDVTAAAVTANIELRELQAIPAINHNITGFLAVLPGVVYAPLSFKPSIDTIIVNGQQTGTRYFLDGGANTGSGAPFINRINIPNEMVQEVVLVTSQLPAEYGGFTGAAVNTITKQGTNAFRGSVYGYYEDDSWVAADYLVKRNRLVKPQTDKKQLGGTLGGPLFQNKLFFFGMVEGSEQSRSRSAIYPTNPDQSFTSRGVIPGLQWFVRVDHQINADNTYAVRYMERRSSCDGDPNCRSAVGDSAAALPNAAGQTLQSLTGEREWDPLWVVNYNKVMGSRKLNVFTLSTPFQTTQCGEPFGKLGEGLGYTRTQPPTLRYLSFDTQTNYCDGRTWEYYYRVDDAFSWTVGQPQREVRWQLR